MADISPNFLTQQGRVKPLFVIVIIWMPEKLTGITYPTDELQHTISDILMGLECTYPAQWLWIEPKP